jgi:hypothetical protein
VTQRLTCALCGRATMPAVFVGAMAVGPSCARKANLMEAAARGLGALRLAKRRASSKQDPQQDLFTEQETEEEAATA